MKAHLLRLLFASIIFCFALPAQALTDKEIVDQFNQGLELLEGEDPAKSIAIFENILRDQPDLNRVRLELALAQFRALNYAEARRQAQQVLADPALPNHVAASVRRFLKLVDDRDKRHVWTPAIRVGLMYDDNVNVSAISAGVIDIGALRITGRGPQSDTALQVNASISHRYLSPTTTKIGGRDVAFAWQSQLTEFRNQYFDETDFNLNVVTARTGPAWLAARKWRFQLPVQVDHIMIGDDSIAWYGGIFPSFTYFIGRMSLTVSGQIQRRDFLSNIDDGRDATYTAGGVNLGYRSLTGRVGANIGMQFFDEDASFDPIASSDRFSNDGTQLTGAINFRPWPAVNTFGLVSLRDRSFDGVEPVFGIARDEDEERYAIGAEYVFSDGYLNDWAVTAIVRHTSNDSTVPLFNYQRNQYLLSIGRAF